MRLRWMGHPSLLQLLPPCTWQPAQHRGRSPPAPAHRRLLSTGPWGSLQEAAVGALAGALRSLGALEQAQGTPEAAHGAAAEAAAARCAVLGCMRALRSVVLLPHQAGVATADVLYATACAHITAHEP